MNHHIDIYKDIESLLAARRINEALDMIDNSAHLVSSAAEIRSAVMNLRESYRLMSDYALSGKPDLSREEQYESLRNSVRALADRLHRLSRIDDAPTLYFNTLRFLLSNTDITIAALLGEYRRVIGRLQSVMLNDEADHTARELTVTAEDLEKRIFNSLWTTHPLSVDDMATAGNIFTDPSLPGHFKQLCLSALLLGELQYHDERRLRLMMDAYCSADTGLSVRALCALLIAMSMRGDQAMSPSMRDRFAALAEEPNWTADVKMAMLLFIRTRDTERIGKKLTDEVIPQMMKLRPEFEKLGNVNLDPESLEENPEWAELLDKSGISDKLRELQELQEDGGDVMMVTFSNLKSFPFFNDIANWFLPYHSSHSLVAANSEPSARLLGEILLNSPLCSSDRFSIILSLSQMPPAQREMMSTQLKANADAVAAMSVGDLTSSSKDREQIARGYVQDLYRFFRLFRRKGEFTDPFSTSLNLTVLPQLSSVFSDPESLQLVGEFYFRHLHFADAFLIFSRLSELVPPSAELFQKLGYCLQMQGDIEGAVDFYEKSELLNSESVWTIRKLANCYRLLSKPAKALPYFLRLEKLKPDDPSIALNIGLCRIGLGEYTEAVNYLHKVEFLRGESARTSRPLLEAYLALGNFEKALRYNDLILASEPSANDFILAGILDIRLSHFPEAVGHLSMALAALNFDIDEFLNIFETVNASLSSRTARENAINDELFAPDALTVALILDAAISESQNLGQKL